MCEPHLLRQLTTEKLDAEAQAVRNEGWAWVKARVELNSVELRTTAGTAGMKKGELAATKLQAKGGCRSP